MRTSKRDGGTTLTSVESIFASSVRRDSLVAPASYASRESLSFAGIRIWFSPCVFVYVCLCECVCII